MRDRKNWMLACPAPECGKLANGVFNAGPMFADDRKGPTFEDSKMQIIYDVKEEDFDAYVSTLKSFGMKDPFEHRQGTDKFFAFTHEGKYYHLRFAAKRGEIRVMEDLISTPVREFGYEKKGAGQTVFYQYGLYYDPNDEVTDRTVNCGMLYIVKLSDNSLFMIDGGHIYQCSNEMIEGLWHFLLSITNTPEDGMLQIAAWYFSHAHDDHLNGCTKLLNRHHEQIQLERVMFNFPSYSYGGNYAVSSYGMMEAVPKYYPNVKALKVHGGQKFSLSDVTVEVMYAHEDAAECVDLGRSHLDDFNNTSSIIKLTIDGKTVMILGDTNTETENLMIKYSEPDLWKADMVQVAHHCFNYLNTMYQWINAPVALLPNNYYAANRWDNIDKLNGVLRWVKDGQIYYEGDGTSSFLATDHGFEHLETIPVIGGEYDFSGF